MTTVDLTKGEGCVTCHAFNADKSKVAFSPLNSREIHIWKKQGSEWVEDVVLKEHDQTVTGLDWGHKTNRIVSASHDRNAYVWRFEDGEWKPTLVILRLEKGCTKVRWSPNEDKFAVGSAAKCVSVCYFEEANDWWVSKHIRKPIRSTVLSLAWSPCGLYLATGSSDFKARVFSTFLKGVDKARPPKDGPFGPNAGTFAECLAEYDSNGWVHGVDFAPSGERLAYVSHDSSLCVAEVNGGAVTRVKVPELPLRSVVFVSEGKIVAGGHGYNPLLFTGSAGAWKLEKKMDDEKGGAPAAAKGPSAMAMFKQQDAKGIGLGGSNNTVLKTKHQNSIVEVCKLSDKQVSTVGADGKLILWSV